MNFNKKEFESFRNDINKALEEVAVKYQVEINTGKIKYSELEFSMELKVEKANDNINVEQEKFVKDCHWFGFKPEQYNIEFSSQGKAFRLVGFNPSKPKNNCTIVSVTDGKRYMCNDESVKRALGIKDTIPQFR